MAFKRSLADLASAFTTKASGGDPTWKLFFNFWKAPVDTVSTVRFLPDADESNALGFLVENHTHELNINNKREKIACLKMYGETCPICELSSRYYDKNSTEHNEDLGRTFYRKKSYIGQVLVMETPVEHDADQLVKLIDFGPQVFKQIQAAFQSGDLENAPFELKGGYNFRFRKTQTGSGQNSYTTSSFAPKQTDVADDVIESITLMNLNDYRTPKTDRATMEAMLLAAQTGAAYNGSGDEAPEPAAKAAAPAPKATVAQAPAPAPASDDAETSAVAAPAPEAGAKLSIVEQLRQRAAASKAAQQAAA